VQPASAALAVVPWERSPETCSDRQTHTDTDDSCAIMTAFFLSHDGLDPDTHVPSIMSYVKSLVNFFFGLRVIESSRCYCSTTVR
jgi:hypothetical protein